jgi:hypothetical protein
MTPSAASRMLSRWSTAEGVSIFAMMGVGRPQASQISRTSFTSSAVFTKERAT